MFESASRPLSTALSAGWPVRWVSPLRLSESFGLKRRRLQSPTWKCWLKGVPWPAESGDRAGDRQRVAGGRVLGERVAVEVDDHRAQGERDSLEDRGDRIGDRPDLGRLGVHVEGVADDDGAEVEGTGDRRGDDGQAERSALVRAGQVDAARDVERSRAGAGGDVDAADPRRGRARGRGQLRPAGRARGLGQRRLGAVGNAGELCEQALGEGRVDAGQPLGAVGRGRASG